MKIEPQRISDARPAELSRDIFDQRIQRVLRADDVHKAAFEAQNAKRRLVGAGFAPLFERMAQRAIGRKGRVIQIDEDRRLAQLRA